MSLSATTRVGPGHAGARSGSPEQPEFPTSKWGTFGQSVRRAIVRRLAVQPDTVLTDATKDFHFGDQRGSARTAEIARAFLQGYNLLAAGASMAQVRDAADEISAYLRPFYYEGAAMGYGPWSMHTPVADRGFEDFAAAVAPETLYQNYVGHGWWLVTRYRRRPRKIAALVARLDFRYRLLCFEGMGFRSGFMAAGVVPPATPRGLVRGDTSAHHGWYQGFGRSLWFVHMGDVGSAAAAAANVPHAYRSDAVAGLGTGVAFSYLDQIEDLAGYVKQVPDEHRPDFDQGLAFGWEARNTADPELFRDLCGNLTSAQRLEVTESINRVHAVRDQLLDGPYCRDFYNTWRRRVAEDFVQDPLQAMAGFEGE